MLKRFGSFQPVLDITHRDDDKYTGGRLGVITYDESDNYSISYLELGMRSDHLAQALGSITDSNAGRGKQAVDTPHEYDAHLVTPRPVETAVKELKAVA